MATIRIQSEGEVVEYATGNTRESDGVPDDELLVSTRSEELRKHFSEIQELVTLCCDSLQQALVRVAKPESVTVEFGVKAGGKLGIPCVTEGSSEANFKVSVTWKEFGRPAQAHG